MDRLHGLDGLFDLLVIGGGIIGCGIARDAALRGLRVALIERADFGAGTTAASTRIVHGGLRYLEMLDLRLVRLDLRERETLLRIAPHLVKPLEFFIPFFRGGRESALKYRTGLAVYDALSGRTSLPRRRWLSEREAHALEPALAAAGARGAAAYHDARADLPERLALENVLDAEGHGASVLNYCEATSLAGEDGRMSVRVRDHLSAAEREIQTRVVVNATGAWLDRVNMRLTGRTGTALRTTKGVHVGVSPVTSHALVLFSRVDGRLLFAIPRAGLTWLGTTDTDFRDDPSEARVSPADVDYLLHSVCHVFPSLTAQAVRHTTVGVRALVRRPGVESAISRMHRIVHGEPWVPAGMFCVAGGKITGYRAIAEELTDAVCRHLGANCRRCATAERPLPGALHDRAVPPGTPQPLQHLWAHYGSRGEHVASLARAHPDLTGRLTADAPHIRAEVVYGVRVEHCRRVSDFLRRRTGLAARPDQGVQAAPQVGEIMQGELGWSPEETAAQVESYRTESQYSRTVAD